MQALIKGNFEIVYPIWRNLHRDFSRPVLWQNLSNETYSRFDLFSVPCYWLGTTLYASCWSFMQGERHEETSIFKVIFEEARRYFYGGRKMYIDMCFSSVHFGLTAVSLVIFPLQLIWRGKVFSPSLLWTTHSVVACHSFSARVISDASLDKISHRFCHLTTGTEDYWKWKNIHTDFLCEQWIAWLAVFKISRISFFT